MDLFGKAKKVMGGWSPPPPSSPQYFRVSCPDGHLIEGRRTESYQALRCPDCGEGVFVLPRSPLPEPKIPANRAPRPSRQSVPDDSPIPLTDPEAQEIVEVELDDDSSRAQPDKIEWVDEEEVEAEPVTSRPAPASPAAPITEFDPDLHLDAPAAVPVAPKQKKPRPQAAPDDGPRKPAQRPRPAQVAVVERVSIGQRIWKHRNALIVVSVLLAVGLAVGTRLWRQKLQELPKIYERGKNEGLAALDAGNFPVAKELLREAAGAARQLGRGFEDEKVSEVIHAADEAAILADLASITLEDLVEKRSRASSADEWKNLFDTHYKGQSIVLVTHVSTLPGSGKAGSELEIDYRIAYGLGPAPVGRGRVSFAGLKLLQDARPKPGDALAIGARLAGVELDAGSGEWLVMLEPDSGVFLQHFKALHVLEGLDGDDETEAQP